MFNDKIDNNTILIVNNNIKDNVINKIRNNNKLIDIKFMTLKEIRDKLYFAYDEKAIYYLMSKYGYKYDVCLKYLDNLYYANDKDLDNVKLKKLINIKNELIDNKLLIFDNYFKNSIKGKKVVIYNYKFISKYDKLIIEELKKITNVTIYNDEDNRYKHKYIYECFDIEEEVSFVAESIVKLINEGIDINNIKICGINDEYKTIIKRIFNFYKIPIIFNDNSLYATTIGQDFLNNITNNREDALKYIYNKYNVKDKNIIDIYNNIVNIINKYAWCNNITLVKDIIIHDFKNTKVNVINYKNVIDVISSLDGISSEYVFLMNFCQGNIPSIYKDEDYLDDNIKNKLGIDTSISLNKLTYDKWLRDILNCKNIIISYKKFSLSGECYISSLNDELKLNIIKPEYSYKYSNLYNKIKLTKDIDELIKYNVGSSELDVLYNNYKDINYMVYDNKYSGIDKNNLKKYMNNKLNLSYSAINDYYHCSFKYYLSNILKLNMYEETFYTILGNLFHYILSICFDKNIDIKDEYYKYIDKQEYKFNDKEYFFLDNLFKELIFVIDTIKKQYESSSLNNSIYEERIEIDKSKNDMKIIFKGFIDKIMLDNDKRVGAIIDYKTGSADINLSNSIYGLDLQLPVYVYLTKYKFPNIRIVGFYLQKIINSEISIDNRKDYLQLKEDKLKLQGYTNKDLNIVSLFDNTYQDSKVIKSFHINSKGIASKKVLNDIEIDNLNKLVDDKINNAIDNILEANFDINPKRIGNENIGCKYCEYKDICFVKEKNILNLIEHKDIDFLQTDS